MQNEREGLNCIDDLMEWTPLPADTFMLYIIVHIVKCTIIHSMVGYNKNVSWVGI